MQKWLLVLAVPLVFLCVLVAVENPILGWLGLAAPVALFVWLLRRMGNAPRPPGFERPLVVPPAEPDDEVVVDAIFDDGTPVAPTPADSLTTIARFQFSIEAQQARQRLEAAGIPAVVEDGQATTASAFPLMGHGGFGVQVPQAQAEDAVRLLAADAYALGYEPGADKVPPAAPA